MQSPDWRARGVHRDKPQIPGECSREFEQLGFIYRAIDAGMVSFHEVASGEATLVDLVRINHYLDMKADIQSYYMEYQKEKNRR